MPCFVITFLALHENTRARADNDLISIFLHTPAKLVTRKDENHALSNHSKRCYKNESRCHRECRLPDTFGQGGVDGAIHQAAGPELLAECRTLHGCQTGEAKITKGYHLPCKRVIHTVGPVWHGGSHGERKLLASCYRKSLALAVEYGLESIAFPLISSGAYGYPKEEALEVAVDTIRAFLKDHNLDVYLVIFQKSDYQLSKGLVEDILAFLKEAWKGKGDPHAREEEHLDSVAGELESLYMEDPYLADSIPPYPYEESRHRKKPGIQGRIKRVEWQIKQLYHSRDPFTSFCVDSKREEQFFSELEESFSHMVLRKIDEKGMTDLECYKKANLDRKLFSKIRSHEDNQPSRATALALGIALELPLSELQELLGKAGYTLSHARKGDLIVEYFVKKGIYDIYQINQVLFDFDEPLI